MRRSRGAAFAADDAIRAIRAAWGRRDPEYHGPHYDFADLVVEPHAARTDLPIWVGGRTRRSLRRAIEVGDGWTPFALSFEQAAEMLAWGCERPEWERRDRPLDVMLSAGLGLLDDPDRVHRTLDAARSAGATHLAAGLSADSPAHYVDQLGALAELAR